MKQLQEVGIVGGVFQLRKPFLYSETWFNGVLVLLHWSELVFVFITLVASGQVIALLDRRDRIWSTPCSVAQKTKPWGMDIVSRVRYGLTCVCRYRVSWFMSTLVTRMTVQKNNVGWRGPNTNRIQLVTWMEMTCTRLGHLFRHSNCCLNLLVYELCTWFSV